MVLVRGSEFCLGYFSKSSPPADGPDAAAGAERGSKGTHRWGDLSYVRIDIERPDEFLSTAPTPARYKNWFFPGYTVDRLTALIESCDFSAQARSQLLDQSRWTMQRDGIVVAQPDLDVVLEMSPATRQTIYLVLAESPQNVGKFSPFAFRAGGFAEWFAHSEVSPSTESLVKKLIYGRGQSICFSDLDEVFTQISSQHERKRLLKTLSREPTVLMKLTVHADSDLDGLADYWGRGTGAGEARQLLEALSKVPGGGSIDIVHLLPAFARGRLYTYPFPTEQPGGSHEDCFWTSMNFFKDVPDERFADFAETRKSLQQEYAPVTGEPGYGDVVLLTDAQGNTFHAAIYLADEVVFTKNGGHFNQPWILMKLSDLLAAYPVERGVTVGVWRQRNT